MKSFAKKFLSIALAAVLLLGVLPMAAFADGEVLAIQYVKVLDKEGNTKLGIQKKVPASEIVGGNYTLTAGDLLMPKYPEPDGVHFTGDWKIVGTDDSKVLAEGHEIPAGSQIVPIYTVTAPPVCEHKTTKDVIKTAATCTKTGVKDIICADCGEVLTADVEIPTVPHSYVTKTEAATCKATGKTWEECSVCGGKKDGSEKTLPLADHTYVKKSTASTCKTAGAEWEECSVCGTIKDGSKKDLPLADHDWSTWYVTKKATASAEGTEERACKACGKTETRAIPKSEEPILSWKLTFDEAYPSPYTNGAVTTYEIKDGQRIGSLFAKGMPIPACNLHVFKGWYLCNEDGSITNVKVTGETVYDYGRNVTLKAKWAREARVNLMIYRNGNTSTPYDVVPLWGYAVGDVINTKDLDIKTYYKNGGKPFDFDGWYDRGGWTLYKAQDNPKPVSAIETVDLNGDTTLFCMVHDSNAPASNKNPDRTNPKTGDESMIVATTAVMLVSAGALAVFFMDRKRRNG